MTSQIRNIAIIAHVDHGKTTMVDQLLRQSGTFADHEKVVDTVMDNNAIERERGITILAKNCAVFWQGTHININRKHTSIHTTKKLIFLWRSRQEVTKDEFVVTNDAGLKARQADSPRRSRMEMENVFSSCWISMVP